MASSCRTVVFNSIQYACGEVGVGVGHVWLSQIFLERHGVGFLGALAAPGFSALSSYLMRLSELTGQEFSEGSAGVALL